MRSLGYYGTDAEVLQKVWKANPSLLMACSSSACLWTANAATIAPSIDAADKRVQFTPANLITKFHRSFEGSFTGLVLFRIFNHPAYFAHHHPLPFHPDFADEGAANHVRLCRDFDQPGIHLFVFGRSVFESQRLLPHQFPARQTDEASKAISRLHRLNPSRVVFAQQNPEAIDAGVFHNDVISTGHQNLFLYHEKAFVNTLEVVNQLRQLMETHCACPLLTIPIKEAEVSLAESVKTYLFNSQLVTLPDHSMVLIAPQECQTSESVQNFFLRLLEDKNQPIRKIIYQDLRESMQNGGGPACLRLRIVLNKNELTEMHQPVLLTDSLYQKLVQWVEKHYRDHLTPADLADPQLLQEGRQALDELSQILQLGPLYSFQRMGPPPSLPEKRS